MLTDQQYEELTELIKHAFQPWDVVDYLIDDTKDDVISLVVTIQIAKVPFNPPFLWSSLQITQTRYKCTRYLPLDYFDSAGSL